MNNSNKWICNIQYLFSNSKSSVLKVLLKIIIIIILFGPSKWRRLDARNLQLFSMRNHTGFLFYSLYNIWKGPLYRMSRSEFDEWLFGPDTFSGLSRNVWLVVIWVDDKPVANGQRSINMMIWCWYMKYMYLNFRLKWSFKCLILANETK